MIVARPGQRVTLTLPDDREVTATILHVPTNWLDRRVLIRFDPGIELYGAGTIVVRRSVLRRAR